MTGTVQTQHEGTDPSLITHEHDSTPFYLDGSLEAAADLQS